MVRRIHVPAVSQVLQVQRVEVDLYAFMVESILLASHWENDGCNVHYLDYMVESTNCEKTNKC